jgi:hypothetical protein
VKRVGALALGLAFSWSLTGCMAVHSPAIGILYTDVKGPLDAEGALGAKSGTACAQSILGLVASGDASIEAAAHAGGINNVTTVDHHTTNILGLMGEFCTIVHGS